MAREQGACVRETSPPREVPVDALLAAQRRVRAGLRRELDDPAFQPVVAGALLSRMPLDALSESIPLLVVDAPDERERAFWDGL